ncbi:MAG: CPBP family intramembrane metalloprotease [Pedobacter sp.]|nr:MAG: CPBP family intramembrane metalloprotease [Pedobacter sp.]
MKKSLDSFCLFLKHPKFLKLRKNKTQLFKDFTALFLLDVVFTGFLVSIIYLLLHFKIIKEHSGPDLLKEYGILGTLAFACIFAPIFEEILFRWHLRDLHGSIYFFFLSISGLVTSQLNSTLIQFYVVITTLLLAILTIKALEKKGKFYAIRMWRKSYPYLFYYTAIIFGLLHLSNYKDLTIADPSFVIYIASQTFGALTLGYLRIKYGLGYSILFHALFNLVAFSLAIFFD